MSLLDSITTPADIKSLSPEQLASLAQEIRARIVDSVSKNGGHLASNLGVVELTLALHYVYDFGPHPDGPDRLLFDVGHQVYPHKMLTGRAGLFGTLRKKGSVAGFPSPDESPYDLFAVGHAGTAISTAVGLARADALAQKKSNIVAIVGDASIVNGLAFEGLNNAGTLKRQLLIILNDNGMSISRPQGAFAGYLERVRVSTTYDEAKKFAHRIVKELPLGMSDTIESLWHGFKGGLKGTFWTGQLFEALGCKYMGPIDGHDLPGLLNTLSEVKHVQAPIVLHVKTVKGQGYEVAAQEPTRLHSPAPFTVNGCRVEIKSSAGKSWTAAFADASIAAAKADDKVVAITAAMPDGTGLSKFEAAIPERYLDTGICESHLVAMAAGMAKGGQKPLAAIYSTFLQRCYDQIWQEVVLNRLQVVFALDRAGFVGDDGAVHHGFMDLAFLRPMPEIMLAAPSDEAELGRCLRACLAYERASAFRYPRDVVPAQNYQDTIAPELRDAAAREWEPGKSRLLRTGTDATLIAYGSMCAQAMAAADLLAEQGVQAAVVDARFCKPLDGDMVARALSAGTPVLTIEDHSVVNGFGSAVLDYAQSHRLPVNRLTILGHPADRLISHATRPQQLTEVGLDAPGIARAVKAAIAEYAPATPVAAPAVR